MTKPEDELQQVTKLVLYGWGYPTLFEKPNGDRFQNRLVNFPSDAAPVIEGASQEALDGVRSHLNLIGRRYRDLLNTESTHLNPIWVWVDTPKHLSGSEILKYREQFEQWLEDVKADGDWNENWVDRFRRSSLIKLVPDQLVTHLSTDSSYPSTINWKQKAIVFAIFATLTFIGLQLSM